MKVLVTGSTGFVGSNLCRALLEAGHTVRAFHRASSPLRLLAGLPVEHAIGDLTQPETLSAAMEEIEVVFHAAAWLGGPDQPGKQYAVTVEGTRNVLQAARRAGVQRVVHTSSAAALGVPVGGPKQAEPLLIYENHTWNYRPDWYPYGYAKYLAEQEVQKAVAQGLDVVIVNPTLIFGPGDAYRQSRSLVMQVARQRVTVAIEGGINVTHIADVVAGHLAALHNGKVGQRYLLGGENLTFVQLIQQIAEVTGAPSPAQVIPAWILRRAAVPAGWLHSFLDLPVQPEMLRMAGIFFFYDLRKAQVELGWQASRSVRAAIEETYAWFKAQGPD